MATESSSEPTLTRPTFTVGEVIERCGVSKSTVKRRLRDGAFPNATQDDPANPQSPWRIPIEDLLAAGLNPGRPTPPEGQTPVTEPIGDAPAGPVEPTVTLTLARYTELVEEAAKAEALQELAWAWKTAHDTAQRQLMPAAADVVDIRDQAPKRKWFNRA